MLFCCFNAVPSTPVIAPVKLLMTPLAIMVTMPHSHKGLRYDPFRDFAPVSHVANFQIAFAVGPAVPVTTLREYVALVKKDPKAGNYASAAAGSIPPPGAFRTSSA